MGAVTWDAAVRVLTQLQQIPALQRNFYVAGGLVPWLIANRDSGRMHGDIDVVVPLQDMPSFRHEMQQRLHYNPVTDSLHRWPDQHRDYGFDVVIDGVTVNIAPFESVPAGIVQRNATYGAAGDADAHVALLIPSLSLSEYVTHTQWRDQSFLGHYPLALVYATKRITQRPKDMHDCAELERLGVDADAIMRYASVLYQMHVISEV